MRPWCPGARRRAGATSTDLVDLCLEARAEAAVGAQLCSNDAERLRHQLGTLLAVPGGQVLVGLLDGQPAGLLLARIVGPSPFTDEVEPQRRGALRPAPDARRRGLGHALLSRALDARRRSAGATEVYAVPLPGRAGMQRFLARLGFAPAAAHRVVSTAVLQRRLAGDPAARRGRPPGGTGRGIEDLIARRRQVRAVSGPVDRPRRARRAGRRRGGSEPRGRRSACR